MMSLAHGVVDCHRPILQKMPEGILRISLSTRGKKSQAMVPPPVCAIKQPFKQWSRFKIGQRLAMLFM